MAAIVFFLILKLKIIYTVKIYYFQFYFFFKVYKTLLSLKFFFFKMTPQKLLILKVQKKKSSRRHKFFLFQFSNTRRACKSYCIKSLIKCKQRMKISKFQLTCIETSAEWNFLYSKYFCLQKLKSCKLVSQDPWLELSRKSRYVMFAPS